MAFPFLKPLTLRTDRKLVYPDGTITDVFSSLSWGWAELFAEAQIHGLDMHVDGGTDPNGGSFRYWSDVPLALPPMQGRRLTTDSITLQFQNIGSQTGLLINSMMMCEIDIRGQIVYPGSGTPVCLCPTVPVPLDQMVTIVDSKIRILTISNSGNAAGGSSFIINRDLGDTTNNLIEIGEINLGGHGFFVQDGPRAYARNIVTLPHVHNQDAASVRLSGEQNEYHMNLEPNAGAIGLKTAASKDRVMCCINPTFGPLSFAAYLEPPASGNKFFGNYDGGPIQSNNNQNFFY